MQPTGGQPPYSFALIGGWIPYPLQLDADTGVISGLPAGPETGYFTIEVTDAAQNTATVQSQLTIKQPGYVCGACHAGGLD